MSADLPMDDTRIRDRLRRNLDAVEERICSACARASRSRRDVTLVAVTKTVSVEIAALLAELGVFDLGESRPQEIWRKAAALPNSIRWHQIGHLQRNKIEQTLPRIHLIHSVDSGRLLDAVEAETRKRNQPVPVLLEVNASREASKHGFAVDEIASLLPALAELSSVQVHGLMTMAALEDDP